MARYYKHQNWPLRRKVYLVLVLCVMVLIFCFSAMPGNESSAFSGKITEWVIKIIYKDYSVMPAEQRLGAYKLMEHIVRKCAHFSEYTLLGVLIMLLFSTYSFRNKRIWALLSSACYAVSDEWHQSFIAGRGPMIGDVLIDSAGAAVGILIVSVFIMLREKKNLHDNHPVT